MNTLIPPITKPDFAPRSSQSFRPAASHVIFQGGKVYDKMPFDKAETITRLGTKLFTRIKDEKEQRLIRGFSTSLSAP